MKLTNVVVIGASGYTGAELIRLLEYHPNVMITGLVAGNNAGREMSEIYPHLAYADLPPMVSFDQVNWHGVEIAFCCLPHGTTHEVAQKIPAEVKIIDVSADFRLHDPELYKQWYGHVHGAQDLQKLAVYGLTEHNRAAIKSARIVACPGCYPTSILLPLLPLIKARVITPQGIIADSKSGITGAGRGAKVENLFSEVNDSIRAYGIGGHRHLAEIEQELGSAAEQGVMITFTPHVVPMNRGIMSVIYANLAPNITEDQARAALQEAYANEPFVKVVNGANRVPQTRDVMGTNMAHIALFADRTPGRIIMVSVIDNLVKGASGQAIQNLNLVLGLPETTGLKHIALVP